MSLIPALTVLSANVALSGLAITISLVRLCNSIDKLRKVRGS